MSDINSTVMYEPLPPQPAAVVIAEVKTGMVTYVKLEGNMTVGRRSDVNIRLDSSIASRVHGQFIWNASDGCYYYMDCNSKNGTFLNGALLTSFNERGSKAVKLENGNILKITRKDKSNPHPEAVSIIFSTTFSEKDSWTRVPLSSDFTEFKIGRGDEADLKINDQRVSKLHACMQREGDTWYITDEQSKNGVFVNGDQITERTPVRAGDVIRIVDTQLVMFGDSFFYNIMREKGGSLSVDIVEKNVGTIKHKTLLKNIKLDIEGGDMMLVLGGAGAGKTTFMKAVLGESKAKGRIILDGQDFYKYYRTLKYKIGIVPQFPSIRDSEKVSDIVLDASKMNLDPDLSDDEKKNIIDTVKNRYSLNEIWDTYYERISGGQKKRVSIAIATFNNPSLFFLDEPDSGLDFANRRNVMEALKTTADQNKMVMVITHAPNDAKDLFTKIMVLAKSRKDGAGHLAFFGTIDEAMRFFEVDNLQSIVVRINALSEGGEGRADEFIEKYNMMRGIENGK